jgi:catalase (peroxidase I)
MFHDAGMFDQGDNNNPSGAVGSVRFYQNHPLNQGLEGSFGNNFISQQNAGNVSAADMIAMSGVVGVRHCGGPSIPFMGGRQDQSQAEANRFRRNPDRLPGPEDSFGTVGRKFDRMGINGEEWAVLSMSFI